MKKTVLLSFCLLLAAGAFAQQKKLTKTTHAKPAFSPEKMKMLCKPWKLDTVETFGVAKSASATEQNDGVTFIADSTLFMTMEGTASTGKWMRGWSDKIINTVVTAVGTNIQGKKMFTIITLSDNYLELEYQNPDLIRTHYFYTPKK